MAVGDVYQIKDKQLVFSQEALNVYYYQALDDGLDAESVATAFSNQIVSQVILIQTSTVSHIGIEVINLNDPLDFFEETFSIPTPGTIPSDPMPSYVSWTFKFNRSSRIIRNGRKAIAGVAESATSGNNPTATALVELEDTADAMGADLVVGTLGSCQPVIYGLPTPPPSSLPLRVVPVASVAFSHLSTQNTRKNF